MHCAGGLPDGHFVLENHAILSSTPKNCVTSKVNVTGIERSERVMPPKNFFTNDKGVFKTLSII